MPYNSDYHAARLAFANDHPSRTGQSITCWFWRPDAFTTGNPEVTARCSMCEPHGNPNTPISATDMRTKGWWGCQSWKKYETGYEEFKKRRSIALKKQADDQPRIDMINRLMKSAHPEQDKQS
jgi:hypothetical protein